MGATIVALWAGEVLSDDVLFNEATNLLTLLDRVYRPIKKEWLKEYGRRKLCAETIKTFVYPKKLLLMDEFRTTNWTNIKRELEFGGILGQFPTLELQN